MIFGIPLEIRSHEYRVGAMPFVVNELVKRGHQVLVEARAGEDSLVSNEAYEKVGALIVPSSEKLYAQAEVILKIQGPMPVEYDLIRPDHKIFAFFNFVSNLELARNLLGKGCSCFAYEMFTTRDGKRPMMAINGEIAGKMAVQQGMFYLEKQNSGRGKLLAHITGVPPTWVTIIGAGAVGYFAAQMAAQLGAHVVLLDREFRRLEEVRNNLPPNVETLLSTEEHLLQVLPQTDLLITAVHQPDARSPVLITKKMVSLLPPGSVVVDVAVDRGGNVETSKATTHANPTFVVDGVIHYCVPNLAGVVPITASQALSSAFWPYLERIAEMGFEESMRQDGELRTGLAIYEGHVTNPFLAAALSVPVYDLNVEAEEDTDTEP